MELVEDAQSSAANDGDQRINLFFLQPLQQLIGHVHFFNEAVFTHLAHMEWINARSIGRGHLRQQDPDSRSVGG